MFEVLGLKGTGSVGVVSTTNHGIQKDLLMIYLGCYYPRLIVATRRGGYDFLFRILIKLYFPLFWVRDGFNSKKIIWTGRTFIYEHLGADRSWLNMRLKFKYQEKIPKDTDSKYWNCIFFPFLIGTNQLYLYV